MADFLDRLVGRTLGLAEVVQPLVASRYAPESDLQTPLIGVVDEEQGADVRTGEPWGIEAHADAGSSQPARSATSTPAPASRPGPAELTQPARHSRTPETLVESAPRGKEPARRDDAPGFAVHRDEESTLTPAAVPASSRQDTGNGPHRDARNAAEDLALPTPVRTGPAPRQLLPMARGQRPGDPSRAERRAIPAPVDQGGGLSDLRRRGVDGPHFLGGAAWAAGEAVDGLDERARGGQVGSPPGLPTESGVSGHSSIAPRADSARSRSSGPPSIEEGQVAVPRPPGRREVAPPADEAPIVRVTIGRIDVRAVMPPGRPAAASVPKAEPPRISLDDYLRAPFGPGSKA